MGQEWAFGDAWPGELAIRRLAQKSSGLFIWAATACRFIKAGESLAEDRLAEVLEGSRSDATPEQHLDQIYLTVLQSSIPITFREQEKALLYSMQRQVLGSIVVSLSPLSAASLGRLVDLSTRQVEQTLRKLRAIVDIPKDAAGFLRLHHPSFRDFLLDKDRCSNPKFWVNERQAHGKLADDCIQLMSISLKRDVCGQGAPGILVADVEGSRIEQCLPPEARYACLYWIQHLQRSDGQLCDNKEVYPFLQLHLLHWLEALSWIGKASEGILAISSLNAQIQVSILSGIFYTKEILTNLS